MTRFRLLASEAVRSIGVTEATYYRWRAEYGGLKLDQVKRLKLLEAENARLRKAVADLTLDKLVLKEDEEQARAKIEGAFESAGLAVPALRDPDCIAGPAGLRPRRRRRRRDGP